MAALKAAATPPRAQLNRCEPFVVTPSLCGHAIRPLPRARRLLVGFAFGFEADTLEIHLEETRGLADVLIAESSQPHNPFFRKLNSKPLIWTDHLQHSARFRRFSRAAGGHVLSVVCVGRSRSDSPWAAELQQDGCLNEAIKQRSDRYDVVVVGSADEILARSALARLAFCPLPQLPTSSAIGMSTGLLGQAYFADHHFPSRPWTHSLPTVYDPRQTGTAFVRRFHALPNPPIVGGFHLTRYCFLPYTILKEMTATEMDNSMTPAHVCAGSPAWHKQICPKKGLRVRNLTSADAETLVVPCALAHSAARFPSWHGRLDPRETRMWHALCNQIRPRQRSQE